MNKEELTVVSVNDQIDSINEQIEEAEKAKAEKMAVLKEMVEQRFDRLYDMWDGALGYQETAQTLRLFLGQTEELDFTRLGVIRKNVCAKLEQISAAYKADCNNDGIDWNTWLDQFTNDCEGNYKSVNAVVTELLVLDVCQTVWEALRRIPEFDKATNDELERCVPSWKSLRPNLPMGAGASLPLFGGKE